MSQAQFPKALAKLETDARRQTMQLPRARTMREVAQLHNLPIKPELRSQPEAMRIKHRLLLAATERMEELLAEHLKSLAALPDEAAIKDERGRLLHREWECLRGDFGSVWRKADRESMRILYAASRGKEKPAG